MPRPGCRYVIASDDLRVQLESEKYAWIEEKCYLEQMESLYLVADEVLKYLKVINQWLVSLGQDPRGIPQEVLFWIDCCEGGKTTQRIQDLLLLIRSYQYLIDTYNITSIVVFSDPQNAWEDSVLAKLAQSKGIELNIIGRLSLAGLKKRGLLILKLLVREPYYIFSILMAKFRKRMRCNQPQISPKEIVLQLCSSDLKFVEDVDFLMKALQARGYDPVTLHWRASKAIGPIQQAGLRGEELEVYVPMSSLWLSAYRVWVTWRQAKKKRQEFEKNSGLEYRNTLLGPMLWPVVRDFFWEELAQRHRLRLAAQNYFAIHTPLAMRLWGGGDLMEGSILFKSLPENQNPMIFFWMLHYFDSPYESDYANTDLLLAAGDNQAGYLKMNGVPAERIVSVGISRYDYLEDFQKEYSPGQSRDFLNIPHEFQYHILCDPNYTLRGFLTLQEQTLVTEALLNFARDNKSVAVLIKPHPAHHPGWLEDLIAYFALPNVFLIDKNMLPYHALNVADLLITKCSTIALEAMLFKKPVISILLDGGERFRIYGDAVARANSVGSFIEILTMVVKDGNWRKRWIERQMVHQAEFLEHYFCCRMGNASQLAAEVIDKFIRMKQEGRLVKANKGIMKPAGLAPVVMN